MKMFPATLLGRTSLYLALILIIGSVGWTAAIGYFLVRPLGASYVQHIADTVLIVQNLLDRENADARRLSGSLASIRIIGDTDPLPEFLAPEDRVVPNDVRETLRARLGNEISLEQEKGKGVLWIRFPVGPRFYWMVFPAQRPAVFPYPVLIWLGGGSIISIIGAYLIIFQLSRRLQKVTAAARAVGEGEKFRLLEETGPQEIRELSVGFNQMTSDLLRHDRDQRQMLAGISHDLRTPLTRVRLAAELLAAQSDASLTTGIILDIQELDSILKQFLDYAREGNEESCVDGDLNELLRETFVRFRDQVPDLTISLGDVPRFAFRPLAMRRVVANLVDNAMRYGSSGIKVRTSHEGNLACLEVMDEGPGVAADLLKEIGRPFVRGSASRSDSGAGLGLAIVDRIIRVHGGRLKLKNRPEGGFVARVELPAGAGKGTPLDMPIRT